MWYSWRTIRVVTFSTRSSLPHRQYSTREGNAGDKEINTVGLAGLRSWRKTGVTRFSFVMESCPQKEHINWSDKILFRHEILSTERNGATRFSFVMESCPQNEHRNSSRCLHKIWRGGVFYYSHTCTWLSAISTLSTFRFFTVQVSALHFYGLLGFILKP